MAGCVVRGGLKPQHLPLHQPGVEAALGQQLLVCALLHHAALVEHHDEVRPLHRAQPVRDDEHRVFPQVAVDGLLDLRTQEGTDSHAAAAAAHHPTQAWLRSRVHHIPRTLSPSGASLPVKPGLAQDLLPEFYVLGGQSSEPDTGQHSVNDGRARHGLPLTLALANGLTVSLRAHANKTSITCFLHPSLTPQI